jgi:hypothetical protein
LHFGPFYVSRACLGAIPRELACSTGLRAEGVAGYRRGSGLLPPLSSRRLRELGRRVYDLPAPGQRRRQAPDSTVHRCGPRTLPLPQAGPVRAAQLLITAGGNFGRFRNEAVCGGTPRSGAPPGFLREATPYATPPGGNRQTNRGTKLPSAVSYPSSPAGFIRRRSVGSNCTSPRASRTSGSERAAQPRSDCGAARCQMSTRRLLR